MRVSVQSASQEIPLMASALSIVVQGREGWRRTTALVSAMRSFSCTSIRISRERVLQAANNLA